MGFTQASVLGLIVVAAASVHTSYTPPELQGRQSTNDPTDFGWIKKWAAIGDSFTAGIGSGRQLGSKLWLDRAWECSRYDYSYPYIVNHALGNSIEDFKFEACSGDRTGGIYNQIDNLNDNSLNLVMMTAGGNDLCLASMIKTCVIMAFDGEEACQELIAKAQENIDTILKPNLREVLTKLNAKMVDGSAVVFNSYAPFFNTDNYDCNQQEWLISEFAWYFYDFVSSQPLQLTVELRKQFNTLVHNINQVISDVVDEYDKDTGIKFRAAFSDWSDWPSIVDGEFCSPSSTGVYPDKNQPELLFIKFNTNRRDGIPEHDQLKRRDVNSTEPIPTLDALPGRAPNYNPHRRPFVPPASTPQNKETNAEVAAQLEDYRSRLRGRLNRAHIYDSVLYRSPNPAAAALHRLDTRAPAPPGCPGDGKPGLPFGLGLPDSFGSIFHPNQRGHEAIASYALQNLVYLRAKMLGVDDGICGATRDDFVCYQQEGKTAFVQWERLNDNDGSSTFDKNQCKDSMKRIMDGCDGNDSKNPLNLKFGGRWVRGNVNYQINPRKERKMFTKRDGTCEGWSRVSRWTTYRFYGRGWASGDWGQNSLLKAANDCSRSVTKWKFEYCKENGRTDYGDYEWWAELEASIYFGAACFQSNAVARNAGGDAYTGRDGLKLGCGGPIY
ncbi:SGNH hydrolase-type esterase domain-containing protein [Cladorrhinum samala]|uniref:SGNH hydrolase-type esterase domain-containing protein n=1 Tax=Cladorrhinum samala TaxID=585594 RepID=A0AAV9I1R6_9PEZI|nr:SGNH hydrolase-type esterase domain-containing protein [Cladorrhinum samala]